MADEIYVNEDFKQMPDNAFYVAKFRGDMNNKIKVNKTPKLLKKY